MHPKACCALSELMACFGFNRGAVRSPMLGAIGDAARDSAARKLLA